MNHLKLQCKYYDYSKVTFHCSLVENNEKRRIKNNRGIDCEPSTSCICTSTENYVRYPLPLQKRDNCQLTHFYNSIIISKDRAFSALNLAVLSVFGKSPLQDLTKIHHGRFGLLIFPMESYRYVQNLSFLYCKIYLY